MQQSRRRRGRREEKGKEGAKEREQPWKSRLHNHDLRCHILKLIYSRTFVCSTFCIYRTGRNIGERNIWRNS